MRRRLSAACFALGDERPLAKFAEDFGAGRMQLPANDNDRAAVEELGDIVAALSAAAPRLAAADSALFALADPAHPQYSLAAERIRDGRGVYVGGDWLSHPFALYFLRPQLDDTRPSRTTYSIRHEDGSDRLEETTANSMRSTPAPKPLTDPAVRLDRVEARVCDVAAERISRSVMGVPYCHPLLKDADQRLQRLKTFLDGKLPHFRRATAAEASALGPGYGNGSFLLDVRHSGHGATPDEVAAGQALFDFGGKGTPVEMKLPAVAILRKDAPPAGRQPTADDLEAGRAMRVYRPGPKPEEQGQTVLEWVVPRWLVVQAERGPDGKIYYGLISPYEMRQAPEDEVAEVKPLEGSIGSSK